jgi:Lon-like ATP-dependent protease
LLKDKKWLNHADEEGEAGEQKDSAKEVKDKKEDVEEEGSGVGEGESSRSAVSEDTKGPTSTSTIAAESSSSSGQASSSSSAPASSGSSSASGSGSGSGSSSGSGSDDSTPPKTGREIAKPSIPETYPQVLALPITRRPLFPGFYKAVTITSPPVIKAIRELLAHGQPYIGAFLLKDSDSDSDVITSMDQVHPVGVFAQITSVFGSTEQQGGKDKEGGGTTEPKPETLTAVLYPHRRIRIDELITTAPPPSATAGAGATGESVPIAQVVDAVQSQEIQEEGEGEVASFETDVPSVDAVKEDLDPNGMSTLPVL